MQSQPISAGPIRTVTAYPEPLPTTCADRPKHETPSNKETKAPVAPSSWEVAAASEGLRACNPVMECRRIMMEELANWNLSPPLTAMIWGYLCAPPLPSESNWAAFPQPPRWQGGSGRYDFDLDPTDNAGYADLNLLRGIYAYGFERPSMVQQKAVFPIMKGFDAIVQAASASGKTCAVIMAALNRIDPKLQKTQVIVLCPSTELARQSDRVATALCEYANLRCGLFAERCYCCGEEDEKIMAYQLLCITPAHLEARFPKGLATFPELRLLIMDEADLLLKAKSELPEDYDASELFEKTTGGCWNLLEQVPPSTQLVFVSTTFSRAALQRLRLYLHTPYLFYYQDAQLCNF